MTDRKRLPYASMGRALLDEVDRGLPTVAQTIEADEGVNPSRPTSLIERDETFAQIVSRDGPVIQASPGFARRIVDVGSIARPTFVEKPVDGIDGTARILIAPVAKGRSTIVVGSSLQDRSDAMRTRARDRESRRRGARRHRACRQPLAWRACNLRNPVTRWGKMIQMHY
jgi:hypothetical protein